jgi:hypothetical protein
MLTDGAVAAMLTDAAVGIGQALVVAVSVTLLASETTVDLLSSFSSFAAVGTAKNFIDGVSASLAVGVSGAGVSSISSKLDRPRLSVAGVTVDLPIGATSAGGQLMMLPGAGSRGPSKA